VSLLHDSTLLWYVTGYGIVVAILGLWTSRRVTGIEDFILAGRTLGPVVLAGTLLATVAGSGTITGGSGAIAYAYGFWPAVFAVLLPGILGMGVLHFIAPGIRARGHYTVPRILETRYGPVAGQFATVTIILAYVGIVSYQFKGIGFILNATTGLSVETGTAAGAVLIVVLATVGGLMAVAPTDALSALLMIAGLMAAVPAAISSAGGLEEIAMNLPPGHMDLMGGLSPFQILGYTIPFLFLIMGDQNIYQRLAAARGEKAARHGILGWMIAAAVVFTAVPVIATTARSVFPRIDPGMALIATTLVMPDVFGGILLAAAAAFIITTGNSYLLSAATSVTCDVWAVRFRPDATEEERLGFTRICIPVLGAVAWVLPKFFPWVLQVQMLSYVVYSAGVTPALVAVFLWKGVTRTGGIASMITGTAATVLWEVFKPADLASTVVSVPLAVAVLVMVSKCTATSQKS
jgi:solute:Na+ symporter, SSS family